MKLLNYVITSAILFFNVYSFGSSIQSEKYLKIDISEKYSDSDIQRLLNRIDDFELKNYVSDILNRCKSFEVCEKYLIIDESSQKLRYPKL